MGKEFETFLIRQQQMVDFHRENVERFNTPKAPPIPLQTEDNEREIARIREHIRALQDELPRVVELPKNFTGQLQRLGRIYDKGEL